MIITENRESAARPQVALAAARACVALYERDGLEVPQWIRGARQLGRPATPPAQQP